MPLFHTGFLSTDYYRFKAPPIIGKTFRIHYADVKKPHSSIRVVDQEGNSKGSFDEKKVLIEWDNSHFNIQRIHPQEYPNGCDIARHNTNLVWISGTIGTQFSVNDKIVGTYKIADDPHGYIFEWPINIGDKLCAVGFRSVGYSIIISPDIYYQYDSYCYRGNC